jgi:hypothetical protein
LTGKDIHVAALSGVASAHSDKNVAAEAACGRAGRQHQVAGVAGRSGT